MGFFMKGIKLWSRKVIIAAMIGVIAPVCAIAQEYRMAITDLEGLEQMQREFGAFRDLLSQKTGIDFKFFPVPNRTAAVEALRSRRVEFVLTGPAEYVVMKTRTDAKPVVGFSRPDYFANVITLADSGITELSQLKGKKVAMGSVGSTSKHLAPMQLFSDHGLNPRKDIKVIHTGVKLGWEALKRGDVDAFATTNDKFLKLRDKDADLQPGAFRVIARSRDLPNDVLLARPDVDQKVLGKLRKAFNNHGAELAAAILQGEDNKKYKGMTFLGNIKDSDYEYVRQMYVTIGYPQLAQMVGD
jgi:phosphonate transport system substrate-binding protein